MHRACDQQVAGRRSGLLCTLTIRAFMNSRRYLQHTCICMKMVKSNSGVHSALHPLVHLALCTVQSGYIESCPAYSWSSLVSMQTKDEIEANVLTVARERWWFRTTASSNGPQQLFACLCMAILHDCWPSRIKQGTVTSPGCTNGADVGEKHQRQREK